MVTVPPVAGNTDFKVNIFVFEPGTMRALSFPVKVKLGDQIGAGMRLINTDPALKLILPYCYATPTRAVTSTTKRYPLIENK